MATIARNSKVRVVGGRSLFESMKPVLSTSVSANQGDLVAYDATNNVIKAVTGSGQSANILGVMQVTIVNGIVPSPYTTAVDASAAIEDDRGPVYGDVESMKLVTGDAWLPGNLAYLTTTDAQTLTSTPAGNAVGMYVGSSIASAASGTFGDFLIGARYNMAGLTF